MSSNLARQYHSMTFTYANEWDLDTKPNGQINTWDNWHLIPTSRPVFNPPTIKSIFIDIPGSDGILDLTESLNGFVTYNNREGQFEFIVANDYRRSWATGYSEFMNWLQGRRIRVVLDDDRSFFYEGRLWINEWRSNNDGTWSNVVINYNVGPYKSDIISSIDDWLWDPFNFETGIIWKLKDLPIKGQVTVNIHNRSRRVIPTYHVKSSSGTKDWTFAMNGNNISQSVSTADIKDPLLQLEPGLNVLTVTGDGTLSIEFRGGSL